MTTRLRAAAAAAALALASACAEPAPAPTDPGLNLHFDRDEHRTIVVDPAGRGGRPTAIQAGIDLAPEGGRVLVLPGTYSEAIVIDKALTLEGVGNAHGVHGLHPLPAVIVDAPGAPTATIEVVTTDAVRIRNLKVLKPGVNGILGTGAVNLTLEHLTIVATAVAPGTNRLVRAVNNAAQTGGQARLIVRESFLDGGAVGALGVSLQADIDALIEGNRIRGGGAVVCVFVESFGPAGITANIIDNDLDDCAGRTAIDVGPTPTQTTNFGTTGVVNIVGNTIRNSSASCVPTTAIHYQLYGGRVENNSIVGFVQACAAATTDALPSAIWVGSIRGFPAAAPVVRFNDLEGNAYAGLRVAPNIATTLDARCNYWGAPSGPSGAGLTGTGDAVLGETGAAAPDVTPFATEPIAGRRGHHGRGSCRLDFSLWSAPVNLGAVVNSSGVEIQPALSPDGRSLYFSSGRAGGLGGNDIWVSQRACGDCPWGTPLNVAALNSTALDGGPSLSGDGRVMFFHSGRPGGPGNNDLYMSRRADPRDDFAWGTPVLLGEGVNTTALENKPFFLAIGWDGGGLLYFNRGPNATELNDLFVARVTPDGAVLAPAEPIAELNDPVTNEQGAHLRADGREMILQSNRADAVGLADLYVSTRHHLRDPWSVPENLGLPINSTARDAHAYLSHDATVLLFSSDRAGSLGERDIWMSTRTRIGPRPH